MGVAAALLVPSGCASLLNIDDVTLALNPSEAGAEASLEGATDTTNPPTSDSMFAADVADGSTGPDEDSPAPQDAVGDEASPPDMDADADADAEPPEADVSPGDCTSGDGGLPYRGRLGPYVTEGPFICDGSGARHYFRGVSRPSLESFCTGNIVAEDYAQMKAWNVNVVRIPLNQDCWSAQAASDGGNDGGDGGGNYEAVVDQQVTWAEANGLDVILALTSSELGDPTDGENCLPQSCARPMPDTKSVAFVKALATRYQNDPSVIFEVYSTPATPATDGGVANFDVWLDGGIVTLPDGGTYVSLGMQAMVNVVRDAGANNLVIVDGLPVNNPMSGLYWPGLDLSGVPTHVITNPDGAGAAANVVYGAQVNEKPSSLDYDNDFGLLSSQFPVMVTRFADYGGNQPSGCNDMKDRYVLDYLEKVGDGGPPNEISWIAWAFYVGDCTFQPLLLDWTNYTPSNPGQAVQNALLNP